MKERNAQFWPISALRILLKCKENPEDYAVVQKMLGHREKHTEKETWHLYKRFLVDFIRDGCGSEDAWTSREAHRKRDLAPLQEIPGRLHSGWLWFRRCLDIARSTQKKRLGTFTRDSWSTSFGMAVVQKMLGHREKHTEKETWHLYKRFLVDFIR